tara:strand:+ start:5580 stop:7097 length:1518 start_codon:yes stop_codon:yes gene_type:complete
MEVYIMNINLLAQSLQKNEITILNSFGRNNTISNVESLSNVEFMRSAMYLENKKLVEIIKSEKKVVLLDKNGLDAYKNKLPEIVLIDLLKKQDLTIQKINQKLNPDRSKFAIGYLKKLGIINFEKGIVSLNSKNKSIKETPEQNFINKIGKSELDISKLSKEDNYAFVVLQKRKKILSIQNRNKFELKLTDLGKDIRLELPKTPGIELNSPSIIKSRKWESQRFRRYDVETPVPRLHIGKTQPYLDFLDELKLKLMQLGFEEMEGPIIDTEFYNFDALYQPQNHPARTWTDVYKLKYPKEGKLTDKKLVERVKNSHETGGDIDSTGWNYKWSEKIAKSLMPRSHTTSVSARKMSSNPKIPGKYFTIGRVFRPDVLDATHLIEFNQLEGIVIGDELSFKNLLGILKKFAEEVSGAKKIRFLPDYYPFTEPSVQIDVWSEKLNKWVEFGGAGIFRPELTHPLGITQPVIAWGLGVDRMFQQRIKSKDIRELFSDNLKWLREVKDANN